MKCVAVFAMASLLALTGCKSSAADVTDAELVTALSRGGNAGSAISRAVIDCVAFLGGIETDGFRGASEDQRFFIDAMCVQDIEARMASSASRVDLSADTFRDRNMAERVLRLAADHNAAVLALLAEQNATRQAEEIGVRRATLLAELAERRAEITSIRETLRAGITPVRDACDAFRAAYDEMLQVNRAHAVIARGSPAGCGTGPAYGSVEQQIEARYSALMEYEVPDEPRAFERVPQVTVGNMPNLAERLADIQSRAEEMRAAVEAAR